MEYRWKVRIEALVGGVWPWFVSEVEASTRWEAARAAELELPQGVALHVIDVVPASKSEGDVFLFLHVESGKMVVDAGQLPAQWVAWLQDSGYVLDRKDRTLSRDYAAVVEREWMLAGGTVQVMLNGEMLASYFAGEYRQDQLYGALYEEAQKRGGSWDRLMEAVREIAAGVPRSRFGKMEFVAARKIAACKAATPLSPMAKADVLTDKMSWELMKQIVGEAQKVAGDDPGQPGDVCEYLGRRWVIAERDGGQVLLKDARRRKQTRVALHKVVVVA